VVFVTDKTHLLQDSHFICHPAAGMDTPPPEPEQASTPTPNERLWTANHLARHIGCSVREIRNLRYAGSPTIKFRHLIRFEPEAVKA
jgi:hypothetical protein